MVFVKKFPILLFISKIISPFWDNLKEPPPYQKQNKTKGTYSSTVSM